jgi:tetratricopeptide (TPR) repeat protein
MMATSRRTTPAAANASASVGSDNGSNRANGAIGTPAPSSGMLGALRQCLPAWPSDLETPRKFTLNGFLILATVLASGVVVKSTVRQAHVVEAIGVPKDLEADGYTSATVGQRLIDAVSEINRTAALARRIGIYALSEAEAARPDSTDSEGAGQAYAVDSEFNLTRDDPSKKYDVSVGVVSLATVTLHLRELLGLTDTRISGEITVEHPVAAGAGGNGEKPAGKKFAMRLRITDKGKVEHQAEATDKLETLFEQAALKLVERFDPLNAAYYSYYKRDFGNALRIVRVYLADPQAQDETLWASNLLGLLEHARYRQDEARAEQGFDRAIAELKQLRDTDPQFAPGLYNLGYVLIDKGRKRLHAQDEDAAQALFGEAYKVALQGIRAHEIADKTSRARAVGYATAARALRQLGRWDAVKYDEALRYLELSLTADRLFISAYLSQGAIHERRRAPERADAVYRLATELSPSAPTFTRVGAALRQNGRHDDAVPMFQRAAELKPSAKAYTYWGMALRDSKHYEDAKQVFAKAIAADPNLANGYNQLGLLYLDQQEWDAAAAQFTRAIKLSPQWSNYHYNLGLAQRGDGKLEPARVSFEKAIAIYPSHAWSCAYLGLTLAERARQDGETVSDDSARSIEQKLKRAVELRPNDRTVLETVARAYEQLQWREQALDAHRRALAAGDTIRGGLDAEIKPVDRRAGEF